MNKADLQLTHTHIRAAASLLEVLLKLQHQEVRNVGTGSH